MEFVINLTTKEMAFATDWCGVRSGKDYNKFEEMKLTPGKAKIVNAPIIEESPLCIECRVKEIISLGSHDMFIADVVNVKADDKYLNGETGTENRKVRLVCRKEQDADQRKSLKTPHEETPFIDRFIAPHLIRSGTRREERFARRA